MLSFTQVSFLFGFLPISISIYLAVQKIFHNDLRICNMVLLCESLAFFWWAEPKLLVWFISISLVMYLLGKRVESTKSGRNKKRIAICAIVLFILLLVLYKELPSLRIFSGDGTTAPIPLFSDAIVPLGISFLVLEAISYIVDIYLGKSEAGDFTGSLVYMLLFPKAACGPIVMWRDICPQLNNRKTSIGKVNVGLKRVIIGYAKKAIIADTLAASIALIDTKMATGSTDSLTVWLVGVLFFFRIYYDFSGYSDIAIGLCKIFGFDIIENFEMPYLSSSIMDFWSRWHISLYKWFKEYVFTPLDGNRLCKPCVSILTTFLLAGIWYGWKINILIWALLNGVLVTADAWLNSKEVYQRVPQFIRIAITMIFVILGWLLFRAPDLGTANSTFKALFISPGGSVPNFTWLFFMTRRTAIFLAIAIVGAFGLFKKTSEWIRGKLGEKKYDIFEKILMLALFVLSIVFVIGEDYTPFFFFGM